MEKKKKLRWNVLGNISIIAEDAKGKKLRIPETPAKKTSLKRLQEYFGGISEIQTIVLCTIYYFSLSRLCESVSKWVDLPSVQYLKHAREIQELTKKNLLRVETDEKGQLYKPCKKIISCILNNSIFDEHEDYDPIIFVNTIDDIVWNNNVYYERINNCEEYEREFISEAFVKSVTNMIPNIKERILFYSICSNYTKRGDTLMGYLLQRIFLQGFLSEGVTLLNESHPLFKHKLIEFTVKGNFTDSKVTLTQNAQELLLGENVCLFEKKLDEKKLILPASIAKKRLFYSQENAKQIETLKNTVINENFNRIQLELTKRGMAKGICVLLYGAPGTGKTETVYQLAKETGRSIIHVNISDTKSCWLGESEKRIQQVFTDYSKACQIARSKTDGLLPILLFNEADAVFQKRTDFTRGGAEKTENAMQNIILENMEKLDGILIATTNLVDNLDAAFERRFLYKIRFENPTVEAKTAIWQTKLDWLSEDNAVALARSYNFSGGEIDNVVRKATMEEIMSGHRVSIDQLEQMCRNEKLLSSKQEHVMGFRV